MLLHRLALGAFSTMMTSLKPKTRGLTMWEPLKKLRKASTCSAWMSGLSTKLTKMCLITALSLSRVKMQSADPGRLPYRCVIRLTLEKISSSQSLEVRPKWVTLMALSSPRSRWKPDSMTVAWWAICINSVRCSLSQSTPASSHKTLLLICKWKAMLTTFC